VDVVPMDDINVPAHETHLESQHGWIVAIIQLDEMSGVTICDPHKALSKEHVTILVNGPISCKTFT
jgi:hypothetical protein